jgi:hypothetical protein
MRMGQCWKGKKGSVWKIFWILNADFYCGVDGGFEGFDSRYGYIAWNCGWRSVLLD